MANPIRPSRAAATIRVEALTRVEGEGGLYVRICGDRVEDVQLTIFEPPRLFEAFLRGRALEEVPDITARICGICPVAYQMSAVHALEAALGLLLRPRCGGCDDCCIAANGSRAMYCTCTCCMPPTFWAMKVAWPWPADLSRRGKSRTATQEARQSIAGSSRWPGDSSDQCRGWRVSPSAAARRLAALISDFEWALTGRRRDDALGGRFRFSPIRAAIPHVGTGASR